MPQTPQSLINLSALTTPASLVTARIDDTSAPFPVGGAAAGSVPTTCSAIMKNANSMTSDTFLAQYKISTTSPDSSIQTNLQNFKNSLLPPVDQGQTIPTTGANSANANISFSATSTGGNQPYTPPYYSLAYIMRVQ